MAANLGRSTTVAFAHHSVRDNDRGSSEGRTVEGQQGCIIAYIVA